MKGEGPSINECGSPKFDHVSAIGSGTEFDGESRRARPANANVEFFFLIQYMRMIITKSSNNL